MLTVVNSKVSSTTRSNKQKKRQEQGQRQSGMKVGAVSLWLLILLSERPMYGYEIIRELGKRFAGYWKPKTGTIYPALEKLEQDKLVTSQREFREEGPDRKHYALAKKGEAQLSQSVLRWIKMMEMLEHYRDTHDAIFRYKRDDASKEELSKFLIDIGQSLKNNNSIEISNIISPKDKSTTARGKSVAIIPNEPIDFKFLYAKENQKLEVHMELQWTPK
ncbi:MAG TPA: PadR family transcriptional regulator [Nitrososphaeraceae archaeon]|nr:PadR family transcriptional regulator [Nitrososphaeraceae archaeon]